MTLPLATVSTLLVMLSTLPTATAKAPTIRITIKSDNGSAPIEITDTAVGDFNVWAGPGVRINEVPQTIGFIPDWDKGALKQPESTLPRYKTSFYTGCRQSEIAGCDHPEQQLSYVVLYVYDAAAAQGFVYIPGRGEPWYDLNTRSILRGLEGNWFAATREWQRFVTPFITRAH